MKKTALIDNDFLSKLSEIKGESSVVVSLISRAFSGANLIVKMHELVFINELGDLASTEPICILFKDEIVSKLLLNEILSDSRREKYYQFCINELYFRKNGVKFPFKDISVWKKHSNLGEIHSISACLTCGYGIFLSDDHDSKVLNSIISEVHLGESITVYSRNEFIQRIKATGCLNHKERKQFKHSKN